MIQSVDVNPGRESPTTRPAEAKRLVLVSAAFLLAQVYSTDYGTGASDGATATLWFIIGNVLLWLIDRKRSRVARGIVIVNSIFGASIYASGMFSDGHAALLSFLFLGQAVPLLAGPVRDHVADGRSRA